MQISGPSLQIPEFPDFIVKEKDDEINRSVIVGGRQYNVIEKKLILIPTKSGQYTIAPAVLNCNVAIKDNTRRNDPFDSLFNDSFFRRSRMKRKILRTNTLGLNVKKLPAYPFDFNFSGVVGRVSMSASIEEKKLKAGDSTTFTIIIKGNGNIMDAEEPFVDVPEGFKVYKDNPEEEIKKGIKGYSGKKIFRMAIVAVESGKYTIPKIKSSYFDVHSGKYRLLEAGPFSISVAPSQPENFIKNKVLSADK